MCRGEGIRKSVVDAFSIGQSALNFLFFISVIWLLRVQRQGVSRWHTVKVQQFPPRNAILQMTVIAFLLLITVGTSARTIQSARCDVPDHLAQRRHHRCSAMRCTRNLVPRTKPRLDSSTDARALSLDRYSADCLGGGQPPLHHSSVHGWFRVFGLVHDVAVSAISAQDFGPVSFHLCVDRDGVRHSVAITPSHH
jgi:hypothetical protein